MSISSCFRSQIFLRNKDILPALLLRTCSTEAAESEETKVRANSRKPIHSTEKCIEYMDSKAYEKTYGDKPVWHVYVRNFKGSLPPKTRKTCVRMGVLATNNPCPICRDEYLLAHHRNVKLLKQFLSPIGGELIDSKVTGVCQRQQLLLTVAIKRAQNCGLLTFSVPHREYDYSLYNKK